MTLRAAIIGGGWAGAVTAHQLLGAGWRVEVFERSDRVGGHSRAEVLNGVVYEPNGAHIFHTSNREVAEFVNRFGLVRPYEHCVLTEIFAHEDDESPTLLSWPPQIDELKNLPFWPTVSKELESLPATPKGEDFETFVISLMGETLYRQFIYGYTVKQWGCEPSTLSSSFAPKRVDLRSDNYRRLFRDTWEYFSPIGVNHVIEEILRPVSVTCGAELDVTDLEDLSKNFDIAIVTAPLDRFVGRDGELAWRGVSMRSRYQPTDKETDTVTAAYVVNRPSMRVPYTRTVETKHASGQLICGTVVSEEYPGSPARHYPFPTVERRYEQANQALKIEIADSSPLPVYFTGRLANYQYIDQDQAIAQALSCARDILEQHK